MTPPGTSGIQEALRRLGNISSFLPWTESVKHLSEYSNMLRISGYTERERLNNVKGAVSRHRHMTAEVERGERDSLYRNRDQIIQTKDTKGGLSAASWFLGGDVKSVITCQATPGSKLVGMIRKEVGISPDGSVNLVMEEGGVPITMGLKKTDPRETQGCQFGDDNCWIQGNKCSAIGSIYVVTFNSCKEVLDPEIKEIPEVPGGVKSSHYLGMTWTSLHNRHKDHRQKHLAKNESNVMVKHDKECHGGIIQQYTAKFVKSERSLLHLSLTEALLIEGQLNGTSMNDRLERGKGTGVIRINPSRPGVT